jgi:crotonobetainyl-CoA:carnitine CoA-transferase CaiB-like acyl-CoA transferase
VSRQLEGLRVLDLSRILAAPFATQLLGDLGADVIKVERPRTGDDARQYGPPFLETADTESGFYLSTNRNKRSITIDHSSQAGADLIRELAAVSDVLVENYRAGVLDKYGLGYQAVQQVNPRLVYCSVTGFGQDGPYADRAGYDGVFQAMSGMMSVSGLPDGQPGAGPMKVGVSMVDILAGLYASSAILAALRDRDMISGRGQFIDLALLDCGVAALSHYAQNYLISGVPAPRRGNGGFGGIPSQAFRCADADIFVVASTAGQWAALAVALDRPELADDPRFATVSARIANRDLVLQTLDSIFAQRSAAHWIAALEAADVPVSPVNSMEAVFDNPQVRHRGLRVSVDHPAAGSVDLIANPISPMATYTAPPMLGEHTDEILTSVLGKTPDEVALLRESGAI